MMRCNIEVEIDEKSWASQRAPASISALRGFRQTDIDLTLLHTALWTRPPCSSGFNLSDCWAWLRYAQCFADLPELRLRPEWVDVDFHQKTIMSDEIGVGLTTQLFIEASIFMEYADTSWVTKNLPTYVAVRGKNKKGPRKTPDYIARCKGRRLGVLECKGSQRSRASLKGAIKKGVQQKSNVSSLSASGFRHSLVAGAFVAPWYSREQSEIVVSDPAMDDVFGFLFRASPEDVSAAITQVSLAKHLALVGLFDVANDLAGHPLDRHPGVRRPQIEGGRFYPRIENGYVRFSTTLPWRTPTIRDAGSARISGIRFEAECPLELVNRLVEGVNIRDTLLRIAHDADEHEWGSFSEGGIAKLGSPHGFSFSLHYE